MSIKRPLMTTDFRPFCTGRLTKGSLRPAWHCLPCAQIQRLLQISSAFRTGNYSTIISFYCVKNTAEFFEARVYLNTQNAIYACVLWFLTWICSNGHTAWEMAEHRGFVDLAKTLKSKILLGAEHVNKAELQPHKHRYEYPNVTQAPSGRNIICIISHMKNKQ